MRIGLVLLALVFAAVVEAVLLHSIAYHKAGGWGNSSAAFVKFCLWAGLPLVLNLVVLIRAFAEKRLSLTVGWWLICALVPGPFFAYFALIMYGHSSRFLLLLGLVLQLLGVVTAWRESRHAN